MCLMCCLLVLCMSIQGRLDATSPFPSRRPVLASAMPRRGWTKDKNGKIVKYLGAVAKQRAREELHGPNAPYRAQERRRWEKRRRRWEEVLFWEARVREAYERGRHDAVADRRAAAAARAPWREGAAQAPHEHGGARSTAGYGPVGSRARPWPREGGEAPRHPAEEAPSSDGRGPPAQVCQVSRDKREAAPDSDHELADVANGDEQLRPFKKKVFRRHESATDDAGGEAFVSESEEEVGGPRRTTRWAPARVVAPHAPEEEHRRNLHEHYNRLAKHFKVLSEEELTDSGEDSELSIPTLATDSGEEGSGALMRPRQQAAVEADETVQSLRSLPPPPKIPVARGPVAQPERPPRKQMLPAPPAFPPPAHLVHAQREATHLQRARMFAREWFAGWRPPVGQRG